MDEWKKGIDADMLKAMLSPRGVIVTAPRRKDVDFISNTIKKIDGSYKEPVYIYKSSLDENDFSTDEFIVYTDNTGLKSLLRQFESKTPVIPVIPILERKKDDYLFLEPKVNVFDKKKDDYLFLDNKIDLYIDGKKVRC